jgi:hypothetical protein
MNAEGIREEGAAISGFTKQPHHEIASSAEADSQ